MASIEAAFFHATQSLSGAEGIHDMGQHLCTVDVWSGFGILRWGPHIQALNAHGVPCDGVVLIDACAAGYMSSPRLWKIKHIPTVDFLLQRTSTERTYELMLRGPGGMVQPMLRRSMCVPLDLRGGVLNAVAAPLSRRPRSRVRFAGTTVHGGDCSGVRRTPTRGGGGGGRDRGSLCRYGHGHGTLHEPPPDPLHTTTVRHQRRERGKQPNFLIGAMDVVANALTLEQRWLGIFCQRRVW